jgi:hypothetical protein
MAADAAFVRVAGTGQRDTACDEGSEEAAGSSSAAAPRSVNSQWMRQVRQVELCSKHTRCFSLYG